MNRNINLEQSGISILEVIIGMFLLAVISLSLARSIATAFQNYKNTQITAAMRNFAHNRLELYAAINPQSMDDSSHDDTENNLTISYISSNVTFNRITDVIVNSDDSRTIEVSVTCNHPKFNKTITEQTTFSRW